MKKVNDFLQQLGLSEIEANLYQGLTELGQTTIKDLADHVGIKRITTHFNIERLIEKGLVVQTKNGQKRNILAEKPEKLADLVDQKVNSTLLLKQQFPAVLQDLQAIGQSTGKVADTQIKYYEGKNGVRSIYQEVVKATELCSYVNISRIAEMFPENPQLFPENVEKGHLHMREIIEDSPISREYIKNTNPARYQYKFFPKQWNISLFDYMIFDGKIAMISGDENLSGIIIVNESLHRNAHVLFEMMWNMLP